MAAFFAGSALYGDVMATKTNQKKEKEMNTFKKELIELCRMNRDGSFGAQANRRNGLKAIADQLNDLGYTPQSVQNLKPKHIGALVEHWKQNDIGEHTIKNRLCWLRWVAAKTQRQNIVARDNAAYGLTQKKEAPIHRGFSIAPEQLDKITCAYVKGAVMLQAAFGLRREEAIKFHPKEAIEENVITLKASTTKGGRARTIPITSDYQMMVLEAVSKVAQTGALIPADKSYVEQLKAYEYQTLKAGLRNTHGLRHTYAARRYTALTGLKCPLEGGPTSKMMTAAQRELVRRARLQISRELGHARISITVTYLGRFSG